MRARRRGVGRPAARRHGARALERGDAEPLPPRPDARRPGGTHAGGVWRPGGVPRDRLGRRDDPRERRRRQVQRRQPPRDRPRDGLHDDGGASPARPRPPQAQQRERDPPRALSERSPVLRAGGRIRLLRRRRGELRVARPLAARVERLPPPEVPPRPRRRAQPRRRSALPRGGARPRDGDGAAGPQPPLRRDVVARQRDLRDVGLLHRSLRRAEGTRPDAPRHEPAQREEGRGRRHVCAPQAAPRLCARRGRGQALHPLRVRTHGGEQLREPHGLRAGLLVLRGPAGRLPLGLGPTRTSRRSATRRT